MVVENGEGNWRPRALIFLHINKTAGTSLRKMLENNYRSDECAFIYPDNHRFLTLEQFGLIPDQNKKKLRLVMGHIRFALHRSMPLPCRYVTVLRDPVDRVLSTYYHHKTKPGTQLYSAINQGAWTVADYLDRGFPEIDNWMTRFVSGTKKHLWALTDEDLKSAKKNLTEWFDFVLLQDRFAEGTAMLANYYGWRSREHYLLNSSQGRKRKDEHDESVLRRILELNKYDQMLYDFVVSNYAELNRRG